MKKLLIGLPVVVIVAGGAFYMYVNNRTQTVVDARLEQLVANGTYTAASYEDMRVQLDGDVSLDNLRLSNALGDFVLQDIQLSNLDYSHETPWHMDVSISGVQFPAGLPDFGLPQNSALSQFLEQLMQDDVLPLQVDYQYNYDAANAHQIDSDFQMALNQAFALTARSTSRGVPLENYGNLQASPADPQAAQAVMMEQFQNLSLPSTYLNLQDQGIVDALLVIVAEQSQVTPEELRNMLTTQARNLHLFVPQDVQGYAMNSGTQLAAFLEGGKTLTLNLQPLLDGNVRQLQQEVMSAALTGNFARIVELLNLEITTE